jgi:tetratricopeptide (TPR) repeat protein
MASTVQPASMVEPSDVEANASADTAPAQAAMSGTPQFPPVVHILPFVSAAVPTIIPAQSTVPAPPSPQTSDQPAPAVPPRTVGVADEIRGFVQEGTPSSLLRALDSIRSRELSNGEFGRTMNAVSTYLMQRVYPDIQGQFPLADPPQSGVYTKILHDIDRGAYTAPPQNADYLTCLLPFLALLKDDSAERLVKAIPDLKRAFSLNPGGVLAPYFMGYAFEKAGNVEDARVSYFQAETMSGECYPAALGIARLSASDGQYEEAVQKLINLLAVYPDNLSAKRQLAIVYYEMGDWSRAANAIAEVLQKNSRDSEFILMRAQTLVEQGLFTQAQAPLDLYAAINPNNPLYLLLRARVQYEGYHNRDAALNYLRSLLKNLSLDDTMSVYAAKLFMESNRLIEQTEGRLLLNRLLNVDSPSLPVIDLALSDAIRREAWFDARSYITVLLNERRSSADLLSAYTVEHGIGNNAQALAYAQELYQKQPNSEDANIAYISALLDTGRLDEAARLIDARINNAAGGATKARYHFLRSRTRGTNEDTRMNDLRSCLFEDPRNFNALLAMFDIYRQRKDDRRAVYYLKQALAISPDNPQLKRYEKEYAGQ